MFTTINPIYSPESISFKNDRFHREMTAIIDKYRTNESGTSRTEFEIAVEKCIKDNTNINFEVEVSDMPMMTQPPHIDKNSPLLEGYGWKDTTLSKKSLADVRKSKDKEVRGLLDPNAGWVDGYFAELPPIKMYVNSAMVYGNKGLLYKLFDGREYTSGEISAVVLHEVGHVWSFFEHLVRFRTTNQILITLIRELDGTQDQEKREIIIKEAGEMLSLENIDAQDLRNKNNTTIYTVIITNLARKNRSQSGVEGYDINSFEALSDQFATRNGAGKDLVTALDKLYRGTIYRRGWASYFFVELLKLCIFGLGVFEVAVGQAWAAYTTFALLAGLLLADSHHDWYDKAGARFVRIRNQLIEELKDESLPKEDSARIRHDIEVIDDVNKNFKDYTQLIGLVYDYLIPSGANKRKQIEFQQSLEEMASNKLFYYANKFRNA